MTHRTLFLVLLSSLAFLSACGDKAADAGEGSTNVSDGSETPTVDHVSDDWDAGRMKAAMDADRGEKSTFVCTVLVSDMVSSAGIAEAIPALGVEKRSDAEMVLQATSAESAQKILEGSTKHGDVNAHVQVRRCVREHAASDVKFSERPESDYQEIDALTSIYQYYAVSGQTPPYEKLADRWSGYSVIQDAFDKRDRLAEITSEINAGIARAKTNPYVKIDFQSEIPKFDFDKGAYPLSEVIGPRTYITPSGNMGTRGYRVMFNQRELFASFAPNGEADAREIESGVSEGMRQHLVQVYGKIEAAEMRDDRETLLVTPTRVTVQQPQRWDIKNPRKLFEIVAQ